MKKFLSLILALAMVACMSVTAFAADGTTIVNLEVPENTSSYTFHCPASVSITYGVEGYQDLGEISVTDVRNTEDRYIIACNYTNLINTENSNDSITMSLGAYNAASHEYGYFGSGTLAGSVKEGSPLKLGAYISSSEWVKATPGATYQATITFTLT